MSPHSSTQKNYITLPGSVRNWLTMQYCASLTGNPSTRSPGGRALAGASRRSTTEDVRRYREDRTSCPTRSRWESGRGGKCLQRRANSRASSQAGRSQSPTSPARAYAAPSRCHPETSVPAASSGEVRNVLRLTSFSGPPAI